jgi:class 3 adenylate cyclase/Tfp pilus assembly protein PilF
MAGTRQLAAIMCTDIDGYGTLIQQDESTAVELKERHREVLHRVAAKFHGKIIQNIGHDSLSLFISAVEAVQCAIEMQHAFREETVVPVKIGIHLGDIIYSGEEAIGDGIMVARKIETHALPGGILISNKIYEEVKNQSGIETRYIKACDLDEQGQQVEVYAIINEGLVAPETTQRNGGLSKTDRRPGSGIRHFWEEAKRRNVVRVIAMYAGAAYVIIELVNNVVNPLSLPQWLPTVVILLLIVGFPVTAILSWIFDLTPEGIKKTKPAIEIEAVERETQPGPGVNWFIRNKVFRRYVVPLFVVVLLVGFYFFKDRIFQNWERVNKEAREHTEKAILYMNNQADPEIIKQELDLALEADPDYNLALYRYALVHGLEGDTLLSKQKLDRIVKTDPGYSNAWNLLASYAFWQDSFSLAMGYTILAIESDPGNTFAAYNLAIQSEDRGLNDQAVEYYRKTIDMDSTHTSAYSALGSLFNKMNRPTDAILILHKSLRISPASMDNYRVYKNLAEAHFLLKEYDKALDYLEQSKTLNPNFAETEKCFARYYEATGENESSILHWRRYLALETDSLELVHSQQHLDSLRMKSPQ